MKRRDYFMIFLIGLLTRIFVASLQDSPGFMDAEYYFISAQQLVKIGNRYLLTHCRIPTLKGAGIACRAASRLVRLFSIEISISASSVQKPKDSNAERMPIVTFDLGKITPPYFAASGTLRQLEFDVKSCACGAGF